MSPRHAPCPRPICALLLLLCIGLTLGPTTSHAQQDSWTGPDKVRHFEVSAARAVVGYAAVSIADRSVGERFLGGLLLAGAAGLGKEALDAVGSGDASARDLAWDGAGIATGLVTAFAFDMLIRWLATPAPAPPSPEHDGRTLPDAAGVPTSAAL